MKRIIISLALSMFCLKAITQTNSGAQKSKLNPGDVDPNAVYLEVDQMHPFNNGAALVIKGRSTALIDQHGNFVVPFNKYNINNEFGTTDLGLQKSVFNYGLFTSDQGLLTAEGNKIPFYKDGQFYNADIMGGKWVGTMAGGTKFYWINTQTKEIKSIDGIVNLTETDREYDLYPFRKESSWGYRSFEGKVLVPATYYSAEPFSDGMAIVSKYDNNGELKYGFVDTTGKEVIACTYSHTPANFYNGMAVVFPKTGEEFNYAFIDKKGTIIKKVKIPSNPRVLLAMNFEPRMQGKYVFGLRYTGNNFIDNNGNTITTEQFFDQYGIKATNPKIPLQFLASDPVAGKIYYLRPYSGPARTYTISHVGIYDIHTKKSIELPYNRNSIGNQFQFDQKSGLAYAEVCLGINNIGQATYRKGYINENGIFVIVMKAPSNF